MTDNFNIFSRHFYATSINSFTYLNSFCAIFFIIHRILLMQVNSWVFGCWGPSSIDHKYIVHWNQGFSPSLIFFSDSVKVIFGGFGFHFFVVFIRGLHAGDLDLLLLPALGPGAHAGQVGQVLDRGTLLPANIILWKSINTSYICVQSPVPKQQLYCHELNTWPWHGKKCWWLNQKPINNKLLN